MQWRIRQGGDLEGLTFDGSSSAYMECSDATSLRAATIRDVAGCLGVECGSHVEVVVNGEQQGVCRLKSELAQIDPDNPTSDALSVAVQAGQISCSLDGAAVRLDGVSHQLVVLPLRPAMPTRRQY
jgi:hypothetical protein